MADTKLKKDYTKSWVYTPKKITVARGLGYGLTDLMGGGWNNIVSGVIFTFLMFQGISPAVAGFTTGIGRIVDAVMSLFIGSLTDEFYKTKFGKLFGRRHACFGLGIIGFAIFFPLFWIPFPQGDFQALYYILIYIAVELVVALILIPWETLPTEMTDDYKLRTVLSGSRMVISATGTSFVFIMQAVLQQSNDPNAYLIAGLTYTAVFIVAMCISWRTTWERPLTDEIIAELEAAPKLSLGAYLSKIVKDYFSTFRNKSFRKHLAVYLLSFTGKDFYSTVLPTFCVYAMFMSNGDSWTLQALSIIGIPATLLAAWLMVKKGPRFLYAASYSFIIFAMIAYTAFYFMGIRGEDALLGMIIVSLVYQVGRAILEFTPWNVFPFIPDVDYIMTRESRAGVYAAVMTFFRKSTGAIASVIAGVLLDKVGFAAAPKKDATGAAINPTEWALAHYGNAAGDHVHFGITMIFLIGPGILVLLALIISRAFRLNLETHGILKDEIHRLEAGGSKDDVTPEAKDICEKLSGHPYSELWPDHVVL